MNKSLKIIFLAAILFALTVIPAFGQNVYTFSNNNSITIVDEDAANPYPSSISVTGIPNNQVVSKVTVKIKNFSHSYPEDVGIMLEDPFGTKVRIFTDCLGDGDGDGISNATYTFDDFASSSFPDNPLNDTPSGTYRTKFGTSDGASPEHPANFLSPAPAGPYADQLAAFNNTYGNGGWKIWIDDDAKGDSGVIAGGWEMTITTSPLLAAPATVSGMVKTATGEGISGALVRMTNISSGQITSTTTNSFGSYALPEAAVGENYNITVYNKSYTFSPNNHLLLLNGDTNLDFTADPE